MLTDTYTFSCQSTGSVSCSSLSRASARLARGASTTVTVTYAVTDPGSGTLTFRASGEASDTGFLTVPVAPPSSAPAVSLAPYAAVRSPAACVAECFDVLWRHSTPAYFTLDTPRQLTLAYNSRTVQPLSIIQLDVKNQQSGPYPTTYSVQVKIRATGVLLTLLNGSQTVYYTAPSDTASRVRLVVPIDARANGLANGGYPVLVTVTANYSSSTSSNTVSTYLAVNDQSGSANGPGLGLAGISRLYLGSSDGSVLVADGDGSTVFYRRGCCSYLTPGGSTATLSFTSGTPSYYRLSEPDGSYVDFNPTGRMWRAADRFGNTTTLTYTDTLLTAVQDPMGKTITLAYDAGKLRAITDLPGGRTTTLSRGTAEVVVADPDQGATILSFTPANLLTGVTNRAGYRTDYTYDQLGKVSTVTAPSVPLYTGTAARPVVTFVAPEQGVWQPGVSGISSATAKPYVLADSARAAITDPLGGTVRYTLDGFGAPLTTVDALGQLTAVTRDTMGHPTVVVEPNGHRMVFTYGNGNDFPKYLLVKAQDVTTGRVINFGYTARDDLASITGDVTSQLLRYHDGSRGPAGALDTVITQGGGAVVHFPESRGRDTLIVHADTAHKEQYAYDPVWGNLVRTQDPRGNATIRHHDGAGRVDTTYVPLSGAWAVSYGPLNQVLVTRNPLGQTTQTVYNPDLTVSRIVDAKGQVYKFAYNGLGALVAQHDLADTVKADTLKYDLAGRVRTLVTRRGDTISLTYDGAGRLTSRSGPDFPTDLYRYDPAGRWMVAENANAYDSLAYDNAGRLQNDIQRLNGATFQWNYTVDVQDRVTGRSLAGGGGSANWAYLNSLPTTVSGAGTSVSLSQTTERLTDTRVFGAGSWTATQKFTGAHTDSLHSYTQTALNALLGASFSYDSLNRLRTQKYNGDSKRVFTYDPLGRLVGACDSVGTSCINEWGITGTAYSYDAAGNRLKTGESLGNVGPGNRIGQTAGYTLTYDANGNLLRKCISPSCLTGGLRFTWDALSRLIGVRDVSLDTLIASYAYDALGRRVAKTSGGVTQRYVYDRDRVIFDLDASNQVTTEYGHYEGTDRVFAIKTPAWTGVVLTDPSVGSVHGLAQSTGGAPIKYYDLNPWGRVAQADTGTTTRFRMAGREYDQETGLYYMRARFYDPELGRFLSEDPVGVAGGLNLYVYANSDPVNMSDPFGLDPKCAWSTPGGGVWTVECPRTGFGSHGGTIYGTHSAGPWNDPSGQLGPASGPTKGGGSATPVRDGGAGATAAPRKSSERAACVIGGATNGAIRGAIRGLYLGALRGFAFGGPVAIANAARASVIAGAVSVEVGGAAAVPTFITTYVATRATATVIWAVRGAAVGVVTGAVFGGATAYEFSTCSVLPLN
jgi:RHS repeat-associated protein